MELGSVGLDIGGFLEELLELFRDDQGRGFVPVNRKRAVPPSS